MNRDDDTSPAISIAHAGGEVLHRFGHPAMACLFEIIIAHSDAGYAEATAMACFERIDELEAELSRYRPDSDVSQINRAPAGEWIKVGPDCLVCLEIAQRIHEVTQGLFDVTVGAALPTGDDAEAAPAPTIGLDMVEISRQYQAVGLRAEGVQIDLGGIGKGFALDEASKLLADWGIDRAVLHSGQSTVLALAGDDAPPWRFALRLGAQADELAPPLSLSCGALSGSGAELHGEHIVDPRTAQPGRLHQAAWALAPTAAEADALSTAFMLMDPPQIEALCRANPAWGGMTLPRSAQPAALQRFGNLQQATP